MIAEEDADLIQSHERDVPNGAITDDALLSRYSQEIDLPAFGCDYGEPGFNGQALAFMIRVARESDNERQTYITTAIDNALIYDQGQSDEPAAGDLVANEISSAVLSITDIQTREPFSIFIRPVETRDKPTVFWIGPGVDERIAAVTGLPLGLGMTPVLDPTTGEPIMQLAAQPMVDPATGQPSLDKMGQPAMQYMPQPVMRPIDPDVDTLEPIDPFTAWQLKRQLRTGAYPPEWLVAVDDRLVADVYQNVFDVYWKESRVDDFVKENLLCTNIFGYMTGYYGWDPAEKQHIIKPVSIKQVFLDPEQPDLNLANYCGYDIEMDVDRAKAEYPQLATLIEGAAREGYPQRVDSVTDFGVGSDRHFYRRTVTFRVFWFRNQLVPMTPAEARAAGHITSHTNPVTRQIEHYLTNPTEGANVDATGATQSQPADDSEDIAGVGAGDGADVGESISGDRPAGDGTLGEAQPTGAAIAPKWPHKLGIRQIATLAQTQQIVQDIRCEHWDIPMLLNKCIPIPLQPFARGIPYKLKGLQLADIRMLNAIVKYAETFSNPGSVMPQSVANALKEGIGRNFVDPSEPVVVPDHIYEKWGDKSIAWFRPPPIPEAVPDAMQMVRDRFLSTSGNTEVMKGQAPSPSSSGRMVEALQAGAAGQFGFQASWTAQMVDRLANMMHYSHLWRLTIDDIESVYSRLPRQILRLAVERAQRNRWNIRVDENSGTNSQTARRLNQALAMFAARSNTGEPVMPLRMVRDVANIDDEEASLQYRDEMQNAAPAPVAAVPPGSAPNVDTHPSDGPLPSE